MADKSNETWINFAAADLVDDQREAYEMLLEAKRAFEATFPVRDGFELRFSYKAQTSPAWASVSSLDRSLRTK